MAVELGTVFVVLCVRYGTYFPSSTIQIPPENPQTPGNTESPDLPGAAQPPNGPWSRGAWLEWLDSCSIRGVITHLSTHPRRLPTLRPWEQ